MNGTASRKGLSGATSENTAQETSEEWMRRLFQRFVDFDVAAQDFSQER